MAMEESKSLGEIMAEAEPLGTREIPAIALMLLGQSAQNTANSWRQLYESEQQMRKQAESTLHLVQESIEAVLTGRYMPASSYLLELLYPYRETVERYMQKHPDQRS